MGNYVPKGEESVRFNLGPKKEDPKNEETKKLFEEAYKKQKNKTLIKRIIGIALAGCVTVGSAGALVYKNYKSNHPFEGELINITNNDEYKELKKEWDKGTLPVRDMSTPSQQWKDDIGDRFGGCNEVGMLVRDLFGIGEDIYMFVELSCFKGSVYSLYKYHVGKDVIENFKSFRNVSGESGDDYFNYQYLIKYVINNYKGELMVQNYGRAVDGSLSEVDGNKGTLYYISEEEGKYSFIKKTGTLPDFILSTRIEYLDNMLIGGRVGALRDATIMEIGELEFLGNQWGMEYVNNANEHTK